jgi:hypothetical protein
MYPITHFLVPLFIGEMLVPSGFFTNGQALLAGLVGLLMNLDHYLHRVTIHKDWSVVRAWNEAVEPKELALRTFIHHERGAIAVTAFLAVIYLASPVWAFILGIGYYSHIILDNLHIRFHHLLRFHIEGVLIRIPLVELLFDIALVFGILLLLV